MQCCDGVAICVVTMNSAKETEEPNVARRSDRMYSTFITELNLVRPSSLVCCSLVPGATFLRCVPLVGREAWTVSAFISSLKPSGFYIYHQVVHLKILVSAYNISVYLYCS